MFGWLEAGLQSQGALQRTAVPGIVSVGNSMAANHANLKLVGSTCVAMLLCATCESCTL